MKVNASDLPRIMACPGSRTMAGSPAMETVHSPSRMEGQAAHWAAAALFNVEFDSTAALINARAPNGFIITADMAEHVGEYVDICYASSKYFLNEINVHQSYGNIEGISENIRYHAETNILYLTDLRYGWQIVEPEKNWTMIFHAFVYCQTHGINANEIHLQIFQPRPYHRDGYLREWIVTYKYLHQLMQEIVWNIDNDITLLNTSPECNHCHALATCPAARQASYNGIDVSMAAFNDDLPNEVVSFELDQLARAKKVIENRFAALEELANYRLRKGEIIENYALEPSQGNRAWNEGLTPEFLTIITGKPMAAPLKSITPAAAIKAGVPDEVVKSLSFRPPGGMKLVRENADKKAKRMFNPKG